MTEALYYDLHPSFGLDENGVKYSNQKRTLLFNKHVAKQAIKQITKLCELLKE